jgi:D-erythro-7,8-dihydroneopterin triphosphate epimerase
MAVIRIHDLKLRCIIGNNPAEREKKQEIILQLEFEIDGEMACRSDMLTDTVDYYDLERQVSHFVQQSSFKLIERLAAGVLELVLSYPLVKRAVVSCTKPGVLPRASAVSCECVGP